MWELPGIEQRNPQAFEMPGVARDEGQFMRQRGGGKKGIHRAKILAGIVGIVVC